MVMAVYLLGLLIGGLYVGMVAPVRTVIQEQFGIGDATGIWMINIYTLFYAALIPVIGKLADRHGRKRIFIICMSTFCVGAALCGQAAWWGGFALLLVGRVLQAVGACGIIPVANAEMGTAFPPEKRGLALGLAAAVTGLANVLGAAVGSLLLALVGNGRWFLLFHGCIPLCILVVICGCVFLENSPQEDPKKMDLAGSVALVMAILLLLLALKRIDYSAVLQSLVEMPSLALLFGALACFLAFRYQEMRAEDPVFHLEYLHNRPIAVTMAVSFFVGCITISMTIVPQFAEAITGARTGSGGYYVAVIGVFSLAGPLIAGRLIDRFGPKPIMLLGLAVQVMGFLLLAFLVVPHPRPWLICACLAIVGLGMGFSMGAPTNYMILEHTDPSESTSAISTLTLLRQMGTSLAPALYVGLIGSASGASGYQWMMLGVAVNGLVALLLLLLYPSSRAGR